MARTAAEQARYEKAQARRLVATYEITLPEYLLIKEEQGGVCAICLRARGLSKALQVDHDHKLEAEGYPIRQTVRGLLCGRDNQRIGWFEAKPERILNYLANWPAKAVIK